MYSAKVLPVMIASPSDVQDERDAIREVVNEWNYTDSFHSQLVVLPVGWETHSSPELGISPQDQINERLVDRCDILVGIFWTKVGSPTSTEMSGTVEEIKRHHESGKPVMLYFSKKPVAPESIDAGQWKQVSEFKKWCEPLGLYQSFSSVDDLRQKFSKQFRLCINENEHVRKQIKKYSTIANEVEQGLQTVSFPEEAVQLLRGAVDGNGTVFKRDHLGGAIFQGGDFSIKTDGRGREDAKWRAAIQKLEDYNLIEERSFGSGHYFVTNEGFETIGHFGKN